jgi:hypothetical protein
MTVQGQADDFDIGKAMFDQLKDLPPERQQRLLRWVSEGLGVSLGTMPAAAGPVQALTPAAIGGTPVNAGGTDIKSFIAAKAPKSDNQFAAAVAYYYRFEASPADRRNAIDANQLQEAARLAGRKRLGSPRATLNNAKAMGYLDSGSPGEFLINSVGENLVAMTLPGGVDTPSPRKRAGAKKKSAAKKSGTKGKR